MLPGIASAPPTTGWMQAVVPSQQYQDVYQPVRCSVCLHQAFGMNYGVPSCNACKMFFRRVVILQPDYRCRFNDSCYRDIETQPDRPKCRACRFKRCLAVGMRYRAGESVGEDDEDMESIDQARNFRHHQQHQPNILVTPVDELCGMIQGLLLLDSRRFESLSRMRSDEDPTMRDLINRSVRGFSVDAMGVTTIPLISTTERILSQWSFFGVWTSVEFLNSLDFMSLLNPDDKIIMLKSYAMNSYLLSSAFQSTRSQFDRLVNPDGTLLFSDTLRTLPSISETNVDRYQKLLVTKLMELQFTPEEYILINIILFSTPRLPGLSSYALDIVSEQQRKYSKALMKYCMLTYNAQGPSRFQKIVSIGELLVKCFEDVQALVTILEMYHPTSHNSKKLFADSLHK